MHPQFSLSKNINVVHSRTEGLWKNVIDMDLDLVRYPVAVLALGKTAPLHYSSDVYEYKPTRSFVAFLFAIEMLIEIPNIFIFENKTVSSFTRGRWLETLYITSMYDNINKLAITRLVTGFFLYFLFVF